MSFCSRDSHLRGGDSNDSRREIIVKLALVTLSSIREFYRDIRDRGRSRDFGDFFLRENTVSPVVFARRTQIARLSRSNERRVIREPEMRGSQFGARLSWRLASSARRPRCGEPHLIYIAFSQRNTFDESVGRVQKRSSAKEIEMFAPERRDLRGDNLIG